MRGCLNGGASGRLRSTDTSATSRTPSQKPSSSDSTSNSGGSTALAHARNEASACRGRAAGKLIISAELELPRPIAAAGFADGDAAEAVVAVGGGPDRNGFIDWLVHLLPPPTVLLQIRNDFFCSIFTCYFMLFYFILLYFYFYISDVHC